MVYCSVVKKFGRDDFLHNLLFDLFPQFFGSDVFAVLSAHDHCIHSFGDDGTAIMFIFDGDLGFCIRP